MDLMNLHPGIMALITLVTFIVFYFINRKLRLPLHTQILVMLVLGIGFGLLFGKAIMVVKPVGTAFLRAIKMVIVPLVFTSITVGTAALGDIRRLGRIGGKTLGYYLASTAVAITIGLFLANVLQPGVGLDDAVKNDLMASQQEATSSKIASAKAAPSPTDTLLEIIPTNPFESMTKGNMLQIIFAAIFLGIGLTFIDPEKSKYGLGFIDAINEVSMLAVGWIMALAPYGAFALIGVVIGQYGVGVMIPLIKFVAVVVGGLLLHGIVVYGLVAKFNNFSPIAFFSAVKPVMMIAFSTASSSATLPISMKVMRDDVGIPNDIVSFVLPLGATVNMNGTALYQGVAALFIAQVYGISLPLTSQLFIVLTATMAAIGTAGVPGVGMIMLAMVLEAVNIPLEGIALIMGVDRIVDMFRTTVNVLGDCSATVLVANTEGVLPKQTA